MGMVYQDVFHKGEAKGELLGSQRAVFNVIKVRFPDIAPLVQKQIDTITNIDVLQSLLTTVSIAENDIEVRQAVLAATKTKRKD